MSGSDLCEWSTVDFIYDTDAKEYTKALGRQVLYDYDNVHFIGNVLLYKQRDTI